MEQLYFTMSGYNRARILEEVKHMIADDGGKLLYSKYSKKTRIYCRTNETDADKRARVESLPPVDVCGVSWCGASLHYVKDGYYYSLNYESNPLFPITFNKIKIDETGGYIGRRYSYSAETLNNAAFKAGKPSVLSIAYDCIWGIMTDEEVKRAAAFHYDQIKAAVEGGRESEAYSEKERVRIPNYYNNGYHYEYRYNTEKLNVYKDMTEDMPA